MLISIASGKGGTGKTTVAVNLAKSLPNVQILDCDVEEPNAHIFIKPKIKDKQKVLIPIPKVDNEKCNFCEICQNVCEYNAIAVLKEEVLIFSELCHGCGACSYLCLQKAIEEIGKEIGIVEIGSNKNVNFVHGLLNIGEVMSPPLIRKVKDTIDSNKTVIIDAPPGTSCPVITAVKDADYCIMVTEPTPFGLYDLKLSVDLLREMKISFGVVINRSDLGNDETEKYCLKENIPILMKIPFDRKIAEAYSKGISIVEAFPEYKKDFENLFNKIRRHVVCKK
ncbi:ATP-binding protein [bacterium]